MNILYATKRCIKSHGGFDRLVKLVALGHNVHILGTRVRGEPSYEHFNGVHIHRCGSIVNLSQLQYPVSFPLLYIKRIAKVSQIDFIHGLGIQSTNTAAAGIFTRFSRSLAFILSIQGISRTTGNSTADAFSRLYDLTIGRVATSAARKVVVLGKTLVDRAISLGSSQEKIVICPPGVDVERFRPRKNQDGHALKEHLGIRGSFVVGFVGRFAPLKGIFDLVRACKIILKEHQVHLLLVGDGPLRMELERVTCSLGVKSTITSWVRNPQLYYSVMDAFVLPSYSEGFSRTCLEAMAMKKAVVVTDVGANKELIKDKKNGFVIPPNNPKLLAQRISYLAENRSVIKKWGEANRKIIESNYTLMHEVERLERIYEEVSPVR